MNKATPEERTVVRGRLVELRQAAAEQSSRLRPLLAHCEEVGLEHVADTILTEIAARTELLRRINEHVAQGEALLERPAGPAH